MQTYKLISGSAAEAFHLSRAKIRLYGGGFANGKTTAEVALALLIARDYPGCNMLLARSTYPKLNTTLRREFIKWCPPSWIKSFDKTKDNSCTLINNTTIDFRYIDSGSSANGEGTSNLLSANYDFIAVDQIDDPEITEHDFQQLLGRLRGTTPYAGDDPTMPTSGPRWLVLSCNPTLGWPYKKLVKPLHDLRAGVINNDLLCERDERGNMLLNDRGMPTPIVDIFEASTYDNAQNISDDYIQTLQNVYTGKMRDRYLLGKWVAFEGAVYDEFDENIHVVPTDFIKQHIRALRDQGYTFSAVEGYDFGIASPSCYLHGLVDDNGILYITDGFYEANLGIEEQAARIHAIRREAQQYAGLVRYDAIQADPAIFRRTTMGRYSSVPTVAAQFDAEGLEMARGNNDIMNGILRVKARLRPQTTLLNPFTHDYGMPQLIIASHLRFVCEEFNTYRWKSQGASEVRIDTPVDKDDHAMDAIKYMSSKDAPMARLTARKHRTVPPRQVFKWSEGPDSTSTRERQHRYST